MESVPISALQHVVFCARQAALIHVERVWSEDAATVRGQIVHKKIDVPGLDFRRGAKVHRSLRLRSELLGIHGVADLVEEVKSAFVPIEVKSGKKKLQLADDVQLCAQALCMEEMFNTKIEKGAVFYARTKRRRDVLFDDKLRNVVADAIAQMRFIMRKTNLPKPKYLERRCAKCSLLFHCLPVVCDQDESAAYLKKVGR